VGLLTAVTLTAHNLPEGMAVQKKKVSLGSGFVYWPPDRALPARWHGGAYICVCIYIHIYIYMCVYICIHLDIVIYL
jgi:hypothetical protein